MASGEPGAVQFRTLKHDLDMSELGTRLNLNRALIRRMELGVHDFTLSEVQAISDLLEIPMMELLTPKSLAPRSMTQPNGHSGS
jgi:predicted transcriptional regulator